VDAIVGVVEASDPFAAVAVATYKTALIGWTARRAYEEKLSESHDRRMALESAEKVIVRETGKEVGEALLGSIVDFSVLDGVDADIELIAREISESVGGEALVDLGKSGTELQSIDSSVKTALRKATAGLLLHAIRRNPGTSAHFDQLDPFKRTEIEEEITKRSTAIAECLWKHIEGQGFHRSVASLDEMKPLFKKSLREASSNAT
jgi:hypothetical protein